MLDGTFPFWDDQSPPTRGPERCWGAKGPRGISENHQFKIGDRMGIQNQLSQCYCEIYIDIPATGHVYRQMIRWSIKLRDSLSGWWFGCHFLKFPRNIGFMSNHPTWRTPSFFRTGWVYKHQPAMFRQTRMRSHGCVPASVGPTEQELSDANDYLRRPGGVVDWKQPSLNLSPKQRPGDHL